MSLDDRVVELAARYRPLAVAILKEAVRVPADQVDRSVDDGGDPRAGLSNHERARLEMLRNTIIDIDAVQCSDDVWFDEFGNLVWVVQDGFDGVAPDHKKVIYLDGHTDTVQALGDQWHEKLAGAIDPYNGLVNPSQLNRDALRSELGYLPPDDEWEHLVFGRGTADQLAGVVSQIIATKILLELAPEGALRGAVVRSYATVAEEDNDGGGPRYVMSKMLPGAPPNLVPDVVILTEGTGDSDKGALGVYRGQRGRMQIEVTVVGRSCHGSMPHLGLNPLEHGAAILAEAAKQAVSVGFADHEFLGRGTRTASWAALDTPSDCAVPERFTFRFDRRLTIGETPAAAVAEVEGLDAVRMAREAGLTVEVTAPVYERPTWTGYVASNPQIYPGWVTPSDHPAIRAAVETYQRVVSPQITEPDGGATAGAMRKEPRVDRWVFSTDGVGFPVPADNVSIDVPPSKGWVTSGLMTHPAMFGIGAGIEQNTHRIGENVDARELEHAIAVLARFPSVFAGG
jgi:putative selenium metabolism hydrolase